jgi:hypothetical protein
MSLVFPQGGRMRILFAVLFVAFWGIPAHAFEETRILFLDGARIERVYAAKKRLLEVSLPPSMLSDSLRIMPLGDCVIRRVEITSSIRDAKVAGRLAELRERRDYLFRRLENLEERKGIFMSAAKSQSGRALRKTRNNPDPLNSMRRGTRFVLSQLDAVFAARQKTEKELREVESRISSLEKPEMPATVARVWLSRPDARVRVAYLVSNLRWIPFYDFRLKGDGNAELSLRAGMPAALRNSSTSVALLTLAESFGVRWVPYPVSSESVSIASFRLPLAKEEVINGAAPVLSFIFTNSSCRDFPSGEAVGFWRGEYFGKTTFSGCRAGKQLPLVFGKQ